MKKIVFFIIHIVLSLNITAQYSSWRIQMLAHLKPDTYFSGCWGWYDPIKNKEYAISGARKGSYFVDITNPISAYIADSLIGIPINIWREIKTYNNYCYIISDDYGPSFQIVDLSTLPDSITVISSPDTGILFKGHTLWVDRHYLYVGGPTDKYGTLHSMGVFNLLPNPKKPTLLRWLDDDYPSIYYIHDMYVRNDTIFASAGNQGLYVFKYDPIQNQFIYISSLVSYLDAGYNHSSALTKNGKTLVFMDEVPSGLSFKIADVSNINNMQVLAYVKPYNYSGFIAHNPFVIGNTHLVASCYQDGTLIYDISNPSNPILTGFFDTYPQGGANLGGSYSSNTYDGNWGSYPFFPSGLILSNDMSNGIFILKADTALNVYSPASHISFSIFPHPVQSHINIYTSYQGNLTLYIYSITGQIIFSTSIEHTHALTPISISTENIPAGSYFIQLKNAYTQCTQPLVIIK